MNMSKIAKLTLDRAAVRWSIDIDGVSQAGFCLFWHGQGTTEFRRTSTGTVEHVTVSGLPQKLDDLHEGEVVSLSHPGAWTSPAQEGEQDVTGILLLGTPEHLDFDSEAADAPEA